MLLKNNAISDMGDSIQPKDYTQHFYSDFFSHLSQDKDLLTLVLLLTLIMCQLLAKGLCTHFETT